MQKNTLIIFLFVSVLINIIFALFIFSRNGEISRDNLLSNRYPYLSKRIFIQNQNDILINFVDLRTTLREYSAKVPQKLGVYFEYLPSGISIGVNEKDEFISASLLKVPLVMATYKEAELGKIKLADQLTIREENIDPYFGDVWKKGIGSKITIEEAINQALVNSDNTAKSVLFNNLKMETIDHVFDSLDIPKEKISNSPVVSAKNYSSVLRSLYLSSYDKEEYSNQILSLLTQTPFEDKLAAGVPQGVLVAHKIGVYIDPVANKSIYTDCGIIYIPQRPYILCLMMQSDEESARKTMSDISKIVYDYVSTTNKEVK